MGGTIRGEARNGTGSACPEPSFQVLFSAEGKHRAGRELCMVLWFALFAEEEMWACPLASGSMPKGQEICRKRRKPTLMTRIGFR